MSAPATLCSVILLCVISLPAPAAPDADRSSDHPLLSRYPGLYIASYFQQEYDEAQIMVGQYNYHQKTAPTKSLEGKITNIKYLNQDKNMSVSALQIFRNYEKALKKLNARFLLSCRNSACYVNNSQDNGTFIQSWFYERKEMYKGLGIIPNLRTDFGLLTATIPTGNGGITYLMLSVSNDAANREVSVMMSIIEPESLDADKIAIGSPEEIHSAIDQAGKVELAGIYFDHDKATIKPESKPTLEVITQYLQANPGKKFYVVGHTDNLGTLAYNMQLSERRATAVVAALIGAGVPSVQLKGAGVGPLSPNVPNHAEQQRAQNRRVELVLQ